MTERVQRFFAVQAEQDADLGPRQVRLRASTEALGRDGLSIVTRGIDLGPYRTNPVMLWQHRREEPVARALEVSNANGELQVLAEFAEQGTSAKADEICALVKQGIVSGISSTFDIFDSEPIDPKDRSAGRRITRSELLEISFVTVPAERNSLVTERADGEAEEAERAVDTVDTVDTSSAAEPAIERAGKAISAATRSKMQQVAGHLDAMAQCHADAMRCLREMMDEEMRDDDTGGEEMRAARDNAPITPVEKFRRQLALRMRAA